ncbi:MAG: helix-turn-helix transcriptional regulator [Ilumatobacteraceae bacterium]
MPDPATTQLTSTPVVAAPDHAPAIVPDGTATIDITGPAFARRFANLLTDRRASAKRSLGAMARRSDKHFSRRALRRYEAGEAPLDMVTVSALASLYEVDIDAIVPLRTEIDIDGGGGVIAAGGVTARFAPGDPDSLLETYLRLVRRLRDQERAEEVSLRREDIERLAAHLSTSGESVVERLGALMGATKAQRRVMAGLFLTGAMVITVAVPSVAALSGSSDPGATLDDGPTGGGIPELVAEPSPTGSDAGQALAEPIPPVESAAGSGIDTRSGPDGPAGSGLDVRNGPDGPGAISIDLLDVDLPAEPAAPAEPAESTADDPVDVAAPADADAPAQPVADPIPVADPPPAPQPPPPPPEPAPAPAPDPAPEPPEADDVATGPPPVPEAPSVVVDPAPAPEPPPPPAPEPPPPAEDETVAVGPPPIPAPSPPIVDPPTDD